MMERSRIITEQEYRELKSLSVMFDTTSEELSKMIKANNFLARQIQIAIEALEEYSITPTSDWIDSRSVAEKALKKMKELK